MTSLVGAAALVDIRPDAGAVGQAWRLGYRTVGKRLFDSLLAVAMLVAFAPLILVLAVLVARDGGRPFFGHRRVGLGGRAFRCWKVRTMVVDAEARLQQLLASDPDAAAEWARDHKLTQDPRVTRLGDFLRRTSLDELPQLWNVLRGDMSLVGPRPITDMELGRYGEAARDYVSVRPGLTGLWQVQGRNAITYDERVRIDSQYVRHLSFRWDLWILLRTVLVVLRRTGR